MVESISPEEVERRRREPGSDLLLLDVREEDERDLARIEPSVHIPIGQISGRESEIPSDRPVVVYCHHGGRSMMVAVHLEQLGYGRVANLSGGIDAWSKTVDPSIPRY